MRLKTAVLIYGIVKDRRQRKTASLMNIEIPEGLAAALDTKARAEGVSTSAYARQVLERDLNKQMEQESKPKKSAYGLLDKYGPGPSDEEIDKNRREMFSGFAEDVP